MDRLKERDLEPDDDRVPDRLKERDPDDDDRGRLATDAIQQGFDDVRQSDGDEDHVEARLQTLADSEGDEGHVEARLQTLADETTGITDVSIASFASDVSDASAFRPLRGMIELMNVFKE